MRKLLLLLGLVLVLMAGCKKNPGTKPAAGQPGGGGGGGGGVGVHAPTGVVTNPGLGGGGSGGAAQAVRQAVTRTVNMHEMQNIYVFMNDASLASGRMPSVEEVGAALQKEAPKTWKLVQEKAIVLTGTNSREGIWAYTQDAQSAAGEHLVITSSGVERMPGQTLKQRLQ
jgi:hypothetical protein